MLLQCCVLGEQLKRADVRALLRLPCGVLAIGLTLHNNTNYVHNFGDVPGALYMVHPCDHGTSI